MAESGSDMTFVGGERSQSRVGDCRFLVGSRFLGSEVHRECRGFVVGRVSGRPSVHGDPGSESSRVEVGVLQVRKVRLKFRERLGQL